MYTLIDPKKERFVFADRYADVAHSAWFSLNGLPREWRQAYYADLLSNARYSVDAFRLIEHYDDQNETLDDCGIVAILPLEPQIAMAHLDGRLSQYALTGSHLHAHRSKNVSYHYIQSLYLGPNHVRSRHAKQVMRCAILDLLKRQSCGFRDRPFVIYTEPHTDRGRNLALGEGLRPTGQRSADRIEIYAFDSRQHSDVKITAKFHEVWVRPKNVA